MRLISLFTPSKAAQHVLQDAAVTEVVGLAGGIDAHDGVEGDHRAVGLLGPDGDGVRGGALVERCQARDGEDLGAVQAQGVGALTLRELEGDHTHADEVGAMDALEGLGDHGLDTQQGRALGRPVA